jgi:biopolymer transport protein TolR
MRTHHGLRGGVPTARSEINVTPLVDVCLVLLIIFMVVAPQLQRDTHVALPETARPLSMPATREQLTLSIDRDGSVLLDRHVVPAGRLQATLRALHCRAKDAPLVVAGDRLLRYRQVVAVLAVARGAGFDRVGLLTGKRPAS